MQTGTDVGGAGVRAAVAVASAVLLAGCTISSSGSDDQSDKRQPQAVKGLLPVAGTVLYQLGAHADVRALGAHPEVLARLGVHALRRTTKGTVLDWSVTPLTGDGAAAGKSFTAGPSDIGFLYGYQSITLMDADAAKVYRPLLTGAAVNADCLCRPFFDGSTRLTVGQTSVFQIAFPALPSTVSAVDVVFNGGSAVSAVPVTPAGQVPTAVEAVDLTAVPKDQPLAETAPFRYPQGDSVAGSPQPQEFAASVDGLFTRPGGTTLLWSVRARGAGSGLVPGGLPVGDFQLHPGSTAFKGTVADGPGLVPAGNDPSAPVLRATYATMRAKTDVQSGQESAHWQQCLCTDWQGRAQSVAGEGARLRLATTYPALPSGVEKVSVTFPGSTVPTLADVPVSRFTTPKLGAPQNADVATWRWQRGKTAQPLTPKDWPPPLPDDESYAAFTTAVVDDVVTKTTTPDVRTETERKSTTLTLDTRVLFNPDSSDLLPAARTGLAKIASQLNDRAKDGSTVTVIGYVAQDHGGVTPAWAAALSTARAKAVHGVLSGLVHKHVKWTVEGKGLGNPVAPNDTEPHRRLNRRVTITYSG